MMKKRYLALCLTAYFGLLYLIPVQSGDGQRQNIASIASILTTGAREKTWVVPNILKKYIDRFIYKLPGELGEVPEAEHWQYIENLKTYIQDPGFVIVDQYRAKQPKDMKIRSVEEHVAAFPYEKIKENMQWAYQNFPIINQQAVDVAAARDVPSNVKKAYPETNQVYQKKNIYIVANGCPLLGDAAKWQIFNPMQMSSYLDSATFKKNLDFWVNRCLMNRVQQYKHPAAAIPLNLTSAFVDRLRASITQPAEGQAQNVIVQSMQWLQARNYGTDKTLLTDDNIAHEIDTLDNIIKDLFLSYDPQKVYYDRVYTNAKLGMKFLPFVNQMIYQEAKQIDNDAYIEVLLASYVPIIPQYGKSLMGVIVKKAQSKDTEDPIRGWDPDHFERNYIVLHVIYKKENASWSDILKTQDVENFHISDIALYEWSAGSRTQFKNILRRNNISDDLVDQSSNLWNPWIDTWRNTFISNYKSLIESQNKLVEKEDDRIKRPRGGALLNESGQPLIVEIGNATIFLPSLGGRYTWMGDHIRDIRIYRPLENDSLLNDIIKAEKITVPQGNKLPLSLGAETIDKEKEPDSSQLDPNKIGKLPYTEIQWYTKKPEGYPDYYRIGGIVYVPESDKNLLRNRGETVALPRYTNLETTTFRIQKSWFWSRWAGYYFRVI